MRLMVYIRPYKTRIIFALIGSFGVAATESYLRRLHCLLWSTKASPCLLRRSIPQAASSPRCKTGKTISSFWFGVRPIKSKPAGFLFGHHSRHQPLVSTLSSTFGFRHGNQPSSPRYVRQDAAIFFQILSGNPVRHGFDEHGKWRNNPSATPAMYLSF